MVQSPPSRNFLILTSMGYSEALFYIFHNRSRSSWEGEWGSLNVSCSFQMGIMWQVGTRVVGHLGLPYNQRSCLEPFLFLIGNFLFVDTFI